VRVRVKVDLSSVGNTDIFSNHVKFVWCFVIYFGINFSCDGIITSKTFIFRRCFLGPTFIRTDNELEQNDMY
jgi:hypothetical protein